MQARLRIVFATTMIGAWSVVLAAEPLVVDLQRRLAGADVAAVNAYLSANWETKMARLGRLVRRCDVSALRLSTSLLETTNLEALQGHVHSLELAMGRCPEKLLPLVPPSHVKGLCAVDAYAEMHPTSRLVVEIDRRVLQIRKARQLASSPNGQACLDAYAAARQAQQ